MSKGKRRITSIALTAVVLLLGGAALAQEDVTYNWTAPTTGSTVVQYIVEHSVDGGAFTQVATVTSPTFVLSAEYEHEHRIRVAGVDALDRQGPFSESSDPYTPTLGAPGQPGKPDILF
jgi:hypothetical protein